MAKASLNESLLAYTGLREDTTIRFGTQEFSYLALYLALKKSETKEQYATLRDLFARAV